MQIDEPVTREYIKAGKFEIDLAGTRYGAKAYLKTPYDPNNERPKADE